MFSCLISKANCLIFKFPSSYTLMTLETLFPIELHILKQHTLVSAALDMRHQRVLYSLVPSQLQTASWQWNESEFILLHSCTLSFFPDPFWKTCSKLRARNFYICSILYNLLGFDLQSQTAYHFIIFFHEHLHHLPWWALLK